MRELPKYARRYVDDLTNYLSSSLNVKKRDLVMKMTKSDLDEFHKYVACRSLATRKESVAKGIALLNTEITSVYCFNDALHFCVNSIPEDVTYNAFTEHDWDKDVYIDFQYGGVNCFLHVWKRLYGIRVNGVNSAYQVAVYVDSDEMREYNRLALFGQCANMWKYTLTYKMHVSDDGANYACEVHDGNFYIKDIARTKDTVTSTFEYARVLSKPDDLAGLHLPPADTVLRIINHVLYCYNNRACLIRKNGKARKKYESCRVHTPSLEKNKTDIYVPLTAYFAHERKTTVYKGGHHASPKEHDRRGYYRKSRGRGDYDLVNGEIKYVGNMKGKYSLVSPTHVNGEKSSAVKIYKV